MISLINSLYNEVPRPLHVRKNHEQQLKNFKESFIKEKIGNFIIELNKPFRRSLDSKVYLLEKQDIKSLITTEHTKYLYKEIRETIKDAIINDVKNNIEHIGNYSTFLKEIANNLRSKLELIDLNNLDVSITESELLKKSNFFKRPSLSKEELNILCYQCYINYEKKCLSIQPILNLLNNFSIHMNEVNDSEFAKAYRKFIETNVSASKYYGHIIVNARKYYSGNGFSKNMVKVREPHWFKNKEPNNFINFPDPDINLCHKIFFRYIEILKQEDEQLEFTEGWLTLSGHDFEKEICLLFKELGIKGYLTKGSDDGGIDLVLNESIAVQCKNHRKAVSPSSLRDFLGSCISKGFEKKIFISSSGYSQKAFEFAKENNIFPFDISHIIKLKQGKLFFDQLIAKFENY